jgi:hypothetical protein
MSCEIAIHQTHNILPPPREADFHRREVGSDAARWTHSNRRPRIANRSRIDLFSDMVAPPNPAGPIRWKQKVEAFRFDFPRDAAVTVTDRLPVVISRRLCRPPQGRADF